MDTLNNNLKSEVFQSYAYLSRVKKQRFVVGANYKSAVLVYAESGAVPCLSVSGKGYLPTYHNGARGVFFGVQAEVKALVPHRDKLTRNSRAQLFSGSAEPSSEREVHSTEEDGTTGVVITFMPMPITRYSDIPRE